MLLPDSRNPTCSALLSPSQCKMSLTQQKNPICQVRNTNRVGKTESLLLPVPWVRHMLGWGPSGACAAALRGSIPQLVLGTHGGGTGLLVQLRVHYPCPCAGHISRHKPAHVQEFPPCAQQGTLVTLGVGELRPCCARSASRCPAPLLRDTRPGWQGTLAPESHVMLAGMRKFPFSGQTGGALWLRS